MVSLYFRQFKQFITGANCCNWLTEERSSIDFEIISAGHLPHDENPEAVNKAWPVWHRCGITVRMQGLPRKTGTMVAGVNTCNTCMYMIHIHDYTHTYLCKSTGTDHTETA